MYAVFWCHDKRLFFFVKLKLVAESVSESLGNSQGVTEVSLFLLNLLESKSA